MKNGRIEEMKTKLDIVRENASMSNVDIVVLCKKNGIQTSESSVARMKRRLGIPSSNVFSKVMKEKGFDEEWEYGWVKTDTASIFIKNDKGAMTYDDIRDELISEMKKHAPKYPLVKREKIKDGHLLIVDPADIHIGKLALIEETGEKYNLEIARQRVIDGVDGILEKASGFPIEKIILVIGNDVLHRDNPMNATTGGTRQDVDGMWWQAFKVAKDMYVSVIEHLVPIADVEVIFCPSNHDYASGYMLADSLSSWFHASKNVKFNCDIIHRKYVQYGLNMLCFDHGDGAKEKDTKDLMADEEPKMWGATKYRYAYKHHVHHKRKVNWVSGEDYIGVAVEYLRSPSAIDPWHHRNGYRNMKAIEGFIHHPQRGQVARLTHYF